MALTSKQRAALRSMASGLDTILQVGKGGMNDHLTVQVSDALKAREIIKIRVLDTSPVAAGEAAEKLAVLTKSEVVTVIGSKVVLYKRNEKEPKIKL